MTPQKFVCFLDELKVECFGNKENYEIKKISRWFNDIALTSNEVKLTDYFLNKLHLQIIDESKFN